MSGRSVSVPLVYGAARWCDTCNTTSKHPVYAYVDDPSKPDTIGTYCPNCPPKEGEDA